MKKFIPTIILRHRKENLKKCSLRGLESREDMQFLTYPRDPLPDLTGYVMLGFDGPELSPQDDKLFMLDGTWNYAERMERVLTLPPTRSLPKGLRTAYPRRQDVDAGLASIEALYIAYLLMGRDPTGLLDNYYWKDKFLELNSTFI
ncbi:MAG: hypothetical protein MRY21_04320 [Simkaniaceae bacterium]|nr:hypothetical protein [Simkaniaceae bacterium]